MEDYTANSNKQKEAEASVSKRTAKKVDKVIVTEVIVQKRSLGRKVKDLFVEADLKGVVRYVTGDVLLPAVRNLIVDASTKGIERMMYGEVSSHRRGYGPGPRMTYSSPIHRPGMVAPPRSPVLGARQRHTRDDIILSSRQEAELVLERLNDLIDTYDVATLSDLNELVGLPTSHTDNKWGWVFLADVQIRQMREGYLLDLPLPEPIN